MLIRALMTLQEEERFPLPHRDRPVGQEEPLGVWHLDLGLPSIPGWEE